MRRRVGILLLLSILALFSGCAKAKQEGHAVMFEGLVQLGEQGVYFKGERVGEVLSLDQGAGYVTRAMVRLSPEFITHMGNNMALYVDSGLLQADTLQGMGGEFDPTVPICGFGSQAAFNWFKFKTLLNDRVFVARQRALELQARMGP
ncbi:MAG: hypothetical protein M0036_14430 [Desulfobacteraceae bacterium]|nr:hypothetical protein [Desulfobacteraceae bacterium]